MTAIYIGIAVAVVALIALVVILVIRRRKNTSGQEVEEPGAGDEISALLKAAEAKLAGAKLANGAHAAGLPVYLLLGDSSTAKTSSMVNSGLEPELLAGQVYQNSMVAPTGIANVWFARRSLFVEAGGQLPANAALWRKLLKRLSPRASVVGKGGPAPRAAVVFFDCENFTRAGAQEAAVNAARTLRARLGEISETMGVNLPVYVMFSKMDRLPFFHDFVRNLTNEEAQQALGVTLPFTAARSGGVYGDEENARLTGQFEWLFRSLAEARPEFLARETDAAKLPGCYEFAREFRKIRQTAVQYMVELCRPTQLTVGPFLRGFYFTGVRPVIINESAPVSPAAQQQQEYGKAAGATGIFSAMGRAPQQAAPQQPAGVSRKVPQWVFLGHFFASVLLADESAKAASGSSVKASGARRILLACAAALCLLLSVAFTVSFFRNRALENGVREAARGIASGDATGADLASLDSLRKLDTLRQSVELLSQYRRDGAPWSYRWGLYVGDDLYVPARKAYFVRFKQLLFGQTQNAMLEGLRTLPATPGPDYGPTYDALKAYLITTSHHDKSTALFLGPVLTRWWSANRTVDPDRLQLAQKQFEFYASELKEENPYSRENDGYAIEKARRYLSQFAGAERVYAFMLAEASRKNPSINFNRQFPGSAQAVVETKEVAGGFSMGGWKFMKDAIAHADRYFSGEQWVLGDISSANIDRAKLEQDLRTRYHSDFVNQWREYVKGAAVVRYAGLKDAAQKLGTMSGNQSPLLALFCVASQNTAVDDAATAAVFQPIQTVVPPQCAERYIAPSNQNYMNALVGLQTSIEAIANQPGQPADAAAAQTLGAATQAKVNTRQMAQAFRLDAEGHIEAQTQKLLEDPIVYAEALLRTLGPAEMNGKGKSLCGQLRPVLAKYPFTPTASAQATLEEVNSVFQPKMGAIWQFYDQNLQKAITRMGSQFSANPAAGLQINPAFLAFLNRAAAFTDAAYPGGAAEPKLTYSVKPAASPEIESIRLTVDGQQAVLTGGAAKQFVWPGAARGVQLVVKFKGGSEFNYPSYDGLWSMFQFVGDADRRQGSLIEMTLRGGKQGRPVLNPATNQPVTVRFEIGANPPVFDKGYFSGLGCVSEVARP